MQTSPRPPNEERRFLPVLKQQGFRARTSVSYTTNADGHNPANAHCPHSGLRA